MHYHHAVICIYISKAIITTEVNFSKLYPRNSLVLPAPRKPNPTMPRQVGRTLNNCFITNADHHREQQQTNKTQDETTTCVCTCAPNQEYAVKSQCHFSAPTARDLSAMNRTTHLCKS